MIDQIERMVKLPEGAEPLSSYSRNYAARSDGKVVAVYLIPSSLSTLGSGEDGCEVMLEDFESRPCTEEEMGEIRQGDAARAKREGVAGKSRWLSDYRNLPLISDGGCSVIELIFDPRSRRIERVACNGVA